MSGTRAKVGFGGLHFPDRLQKAMNKRDRRAQQVMLEELAGGFGLAAQERAWDQVLPSWREDVALMWKRSDEELTALEKSKVELLLGRMRANNALLQSAFVNLMARHHPERPAP